MRRCLATTHQVWRGRRRGQKEAGRGGLAPTVAVPFIPLHREQHHRHRGPQPHSHSLGGGHIQNASYTENSRIYSIQHDLQYTSRSTVYSTIYSTHHDLQHTARSTVHIAICSTHHDLQYTARSTVYSTVNTIQCKTYTVRNEYSA